MKIPIALCISKKRKRPEICVFAANGGEAQKKRKIRLRSSKKSLHVNVVPYVFSSVLLSVIGLFSCYHGYGCHAAFVRGGR